MLDPVVDLLRKLGRVVRLEQAALIQGKLDGGRLVFLLIEAVRGKPVNREAEGMVHFAGLLLLMGLLVFVTFKDIRGLF